MKINETTIESNTTIGNGKWLRRHLIQLMIVSIGIVGSWYELKTRVQADEFKIKEISQEIDYHSHLSTHPGSATKESVIELRKKVNKLSDKVDTLIVRQSVMRNDLTYIKQGIKDIKGAINKPAQ